MAKELLFTLTKNDFKIEFTEQAAKEAKTAIKGYCL